MELCEERQLLMRLLLLLRHPVLLLLRHPVLQRPPVLQPLLRHPVLLPLLRHPVLQVLVPVDRAMVKVMEMGTASARGETTGMATTVTGMGTGTALATAAEMDTEIA